MSKGPLQLFRWQEHHRSVNSSYFLQTAIITNSVEHLKTLQITRRKIADRMEWENRTRKLFRWSIWKDTNRKVLAQV